MGFSSTSLRLDATMVLAKAKAVPIIHIHIIRSMALEPSTTYLKNFNLKPYTLRTHYFKKGLPKSMCTCL